MDFLVFLFFSESCVTVGSPTLKLKKLGTFNIAQNPTLIIDPGIFYRTVVW